ncbi:MAG TPA: Stk1 family PASTA domain-containing Ser/Thr kinase [Coriobacteriia bacterium]
MEERVFGNRYRVTERIGTGGMADVYKAVDQVLGRTVAIKVLHPRYAADPTFVARFRQEAQAAANLSNPHIVNIYDWGQEDSTYYIVMEYVRGTDLKTLVDEKGPVDPAKAAEYGAQVCQALAVAHGYDIVHRDIKPHNIVLTPDGAVKVMDFGIARAGNTTMTQTGSVLGTAQYISPEQAQGRPIGPASDLYSLGVVLYELTTGRLPFEGDTPVSVALKQVNEQPVPPRQIEPGIPPALESVILKAMAKDPAQRYGSADEMRDDLRRVVAGQPVTAVPAAMDHTSVMPAVGGGETVTHRAPAARPERRRGAAWAWVLALIALVLIGGLLAWAAFMQPKNVPVPDVTNIPVAEATATIERAGLKVGDIKLQNDSSVKQGYVISQSPPAKTPIPAGQTVDLLVSSGAQKLKVPDLTGMTEQNAINEIQAAGFQVGTRSEKNDKSAAGTVVGQNPKPDTLVPVPPSGLPRIDYTISLGVKMVNVPLVQGKSQDAATSALQNAGFKVKVQKQTSTDVPKGTVIDSDPSGGSQAPAGSTVTIIVSGGPEMVTVPNVKTLPEPQAQSKLEGLGFAVTVDSTATPDPSMVGKIVDQTPVGGSLAPKGSTVTIWVGTSGP